MAAWGVRREPPLPACGPLISRPAVSRAAGPVPRGRSPRPRSRSEVKYHFLLLGNGPPPHNWVNAIDPQEPQVPQTEAVTAAALGSLGVPQRKWMAKMLLSPNPTVPTLLVATR